jgi:hypothetical protein
MSMTVEQLMEGKAILVTECSSDHSAPPAGTVGPIFRFLPPSSWNALPDSLASRLVVWLKAQWSFSPAYDWPGNIRELQNVIERAVVFSKGPVLSLGSDLLPAHTASPLEEVMPLGNAYSVGSAHSTLEQVEKRHILSVLEQTSWVIEGDRGAAKILDLHPNTLRSRMKKRGIDRSSAKVDASHGTPNPREAAL